GLLLRIGYPADGSCENAVYDSLAEALNAEGWLSPSGLPWYEPILRSACRYAPAPDGGIRRLGNREVNRILGEDRASGSDLLPLPSVDAREPDEVGDVVGGDRRHVAKTGYHGRRCRHDAIRAE